MNGHLYLSTPSSFYLPFTTSNDLLEQNVLALFSLQRKWRVNGGVSELLETRRVLTSTRVSSNFGRREFRRSSERWRKLARFPPPRSTLLRTRCYTVFVETEHSPSLDGVRPESLNLGISLVWRAHSDYRIHLNATQTPVVSEGRPIKENRPCGLSYEAIDVRIPYIRRP